MQNDYQRSLIYLGHLFAMADGVKDEAERDLLKTLRASEKIEDKFYYDLQNEIYASSNREILKKGIHCLKRCEKEEILKAFAWLFRILDADDCLKVNEIRIMLFVLKHFDITLEQVINELRKNSKR